MRARLRGVRARRELLGAEGGTVSSGQAAELLGITPQAVDKRRRTGKLLALPVGRAYLYPLYPVWQFDEGGRGGVLGGLEEVLGSFGVEDAWMRASFFLRENGRLDEKRPLDALRDGEIESVERAARLWGTPRRVTEGLGPPLHNLNERELPIVRLEGPWLRLDAKSTIMG